MKFIQLLKERSPKITGSTLKIIAMIGMLIDHYAAVFLVRWIKYKRVEYMLHPESLDFLYQIYEILRLIGRISFPIFIFLLVEGVVHTSSKWKYLGRMIFLALISEVPYDLASHLHERQVLNGRILEFENQNIFFTLSIGLLVILLIECVQERKFHKIIRNILCTSIVIIGIYISYLLRGEYLEFGYLAIVVMYLFRKNRIIASLVSNFVLILMSQVQIAGLVSLIPIFLYNGKRGMNLKWLFYFFYPIHLFFLWAICFVMGIA